MVPVKAGHMQRGRPVVLVHIIQDKAALSVVPALSENGLYARTVVIVDRSTKRSSQLADLVRRHVLSGYHIITGNQVKFSGLGCTNF